MKRINTNPILAQWHSPGNKTWNPQFFLKSRISVEVGKRCNRQSFSLQNWDQSFTHMLIILLHWTGYVSDQISKKFSRNISVELYSVHVNFIPKLRRSIINRGKMNACGDSVKFYLFALLVSVKQRSNSPMLAIV